VLLDLNMPGLDGHRVLRAARAEPRTRRVPIVVLTSSSAPDDVATCYDLGANSVVHKPIAYDEFLIKAKALTRYWLGLNQRAEAAR
jgi:two-component system response regulator